MDKQEIIRAILDDIQSKVNSRFTRPDMALSKRAMLDITESINKHLPDTQEPDVVGMLENQDEQNEAN